MTREPNTTVNGRSHSGPDAVYRTRGPGPVRETRGPGSMGETRGDMRSDHFGANAAGHPAHRNSGTMRQRGDPLPRTRYTVSCAGLDGETDDRTELRPLGRGRGHRRRRSRRGGTVGGLGDRRNGDQHQRARGQDAASGRTGQLGLRYRPGALARIPRRNPPRLCRPSRRDNGNPDTFSNSADHAAHIPDVVGRDSQNWPGIFPIRCR